MYMIASPLSLILVPAASSSSLRFRIRKGLIQRFAQLSKASIRHLSSSSISGSSMSSTEQKPGPGDPCPITKLFIWYCHLFLSRLQVRQVAMFGRRAAPSPRGWSSAGTPESTTRLGPRKPSGHDQLQPVTVNSWPRGSF
ncbi:hypothetical protein LshimejAT787_0505910 [Lyophyllum shimeji]|uniref:Uncharacterized protein n=1 Tax=Lyophyllum shimeji TaxID=47721 RepID=A0A9P3UPY8_LYOSH|nr:hypothetical protein LshimejAT787_0505910 [Lyophyllum shimeji]